MAFNTHKYLDKDGAVLPAGLGRTARFKIESFTSSEHVLLEKHKSSWVTACSGSLTEIKSWLGECLDTPVKSEVKDKQKEYVHNVTKAVMPRVSHLPGIDIQQVDNYIYLLLWRNKFSGRNRVINMRWTDRLGQPLYLLYTGDYSRPITLRNAYLVDSISQAQQLFPGVTQVRLPDPLQWSDDTADYFWDPTMEILTLSNRAMAHITEERTTRLSGAIKSMDAQTILRNVKEALSTGQQRACQDCAFALPSYSRRHNNISMLLPLHVYTKNSELPEAVMLLTKKLHGYSLVTLITPQQAYISVRSFRDPEMTWLKGALTVK